MGGQKEKERESVPVGWATDSLVWYLIGGGCWPSWLLGGAERGEVGNQGINFFSGEGVTEVLHH